jgi:hypothetical protein
MPPPSKKIFLSHSSKDEPLVDKLTDLLTTGCGVRADEILVTTLPGKGIPAGYDNYIEYLKQQIQKPALVILLLSENYFASQFCLCELGATWALSLPNFPIVVPPLKKSEVKATLAVTQLGIISDSDYLDELRDRVKTQLGDTLPTATWNTKRDAFLGRLPRILKSLPSPEMVRRTELKEAQAQYQSALKEIQNKDEQIETLNAKISELEECKDSTDVKKVRRKYSSSDEEFEKLCHDAKRALSKVASATAEAIYWDRRGERYVPADQSEWTDAHEAEAIQEISVDERGCEPDSAHPRVNKAQDAVNNLDDFLSKLKDHTFFEAFEEEHQFPATVSNKEFWDKFL